MSETWRECEVRFPGSVGTISWFAVEQPDAKTLIIATEDHMDPAVIARVKALPKREKNAFDLFIGCMDGRSRTVEKCAFKKHEFRTDSAKPVHVFTFRLFS